jgi:tetratricopeptide (TPR) repeat protein
MARRLRRRDMKGNMILYRPVSLQELELIFDSDMQSFPPRLPKQPIFYPVLQLEYARQTASKWNAKSGQSAGYVTEFKVEDDYIGRFETRTVGKSQYQELWIPAEEMEEFNKHIVGHIKVVEAHFGNEFQGFVPDKFALAGKNPVDQFTLLANTYLYKRMDFYLEIQRNHKAVFLNYPFWQTYEFKNPGLKDKILQAIKEAWLTSFPKIPLPNPAPKDIKPVEPSHKPPSANPVQKDNTPGKQTPAPARPLVLPVPAETPPVKRTPAKHFMDPDEEDVTPQEETDSDSFDNSPDEDVTHVTQTDASAERWVEPVDEEITPEEETDSDSFDTPLHEDVPGNQTHAQHWVNPVHEKTTPPAKTNLHFVQGLKLGLSGEYSDAVEELSNAVEEDPDDVVAHTSLGVAFHRLGDDDRAVACYETALRIDPIFAEAHYFRANILYVQGNVREAIAGYTIALGLQPQLIEAHQKPIPQDRLTDYRHAPAEMFRIARPAYRILELNKLLESDPRQANLFKERAAAFYRLRNYAQVIADYNSALAVQPEDAGALHLRGVAYEQLGQSERALEDYQQALAFNPQLSNEYINRGVTFGQMGNLDQSIASLTEAVRLAPGNPDGYFNRGVVYFQQGNFESAIEDFSNVIRLSPNDEEACYWRGISYEQMGRQREAVADYRQFLALSRDEDARMQIQQKLSQWNEAKLNDLSSQNNDRQETSQVQAEKRDHDLDLYDLIIALGERALHSTWFGSGVDCYGEKAEELYEFTDHNRPIDGRDLLRITSGIRQTVAGDFTAAEPGAASHWIFIRAWDGSGFYVETDDPQVEKQLKAHFAAVEEVEGAEPPYAGFFIPIKSLST